MSNSDSVFMAFPASQTLADNIRQLIRNLEEGKREPQAPLLTSVVLDLTDELIKVFLLDLVHLIKLSPFMEKLVTSTAGAIRTTAHGIIKTVVGKLDNKQMLPLANYLRDHLLMAPDHQGQLVPWVGFPCDEAFDRRVVALLAGLRGEQPQTQAAELAEVLGLVVDRVLDAFIVQPVDLLKLGFVLRKIVDGGAAVIDKASRTMIRKMVPDLAAAQLLASADYIDALRVVSPQRER